MRPEDQTPLKPRGLASAPKFLEDSQNKFLANEDENAYVQLEVFGDPAPKAQWFRGDIDLSEVGRFKFWTDGVRGFVFMGVESCTKADEGVYRCIITNRFGKREHKFKLFISRSFRRGPPKREVPVYWSDVPRAKFIKQGSTDQVSFTAKLTVSDTTAKWFFKEEACSNGGKYDVTQGGGAFTVVIKNPSPEDTGCYKCVLDNIKELFCETYLDVQLPDPEYNFLKPLPPIYPGYIGRSLRLSCLCAEDAQVSWFKDEEEINEEDEHYKTSSNEGEHVLEIASPDDKDSATYSCKIIKFGKEGESETSSLVQITDFPHKFAKRLPQSINLVERESLLLQTTTQETFASVKWLKNGQELAEGRKRNQRVKLLVREGLHCLAIDRCAVTDQGVYTARTNKEETSCDVQITEFQHRFTKGLNEITNVTEDGKVAFEVEVEDEEAVVTWLHNDVESKPERSRIARIQIESEGKKRCLSIKKCTSEDVAKITARTNADTTSTDLIVKCHNSFCQRLCETAECSEHCRMEIFVQVKDTTAPVYFLLDKFPIEMEDGRFQQEDLGQGHHKLTITKVSKRDEGVLSCKTPTNRGDEMLESKCIFNVTEGESPPFIGKVEPVSCVAILHSYSDRMNSYIQKEACKLVIPYKIEGTRKSNLDILVEKEGQEVEIGNDIQMKVRSDRVVIDIMNPNRTNSGIYKVTISNDQGSCEIDVPVEVLDIPSPPLSVSVLEVRKDSVLIQWKKPEDDGGTPIKHFVTEILDFTTNNMWTSVAMSDTGDCTEQLLQHLIEGHRYCFRVATANRIGQSEPTETQGEIITKDPWDAPYPCGKAQIIDWTPTFADISWTGPTNDGGSPVTSFIIEVKESSMRNWMEGTVIPIEEVEFEGDLYRGRCENLMEEYEYRFRVIAVNRAGKSNPGSGSEPVIAMHKNVSPYIKGEGLKDINIKEGKSLRFDVWVGGEPVPTIEWLRDDIRITNDDTTSISVYTKTSSAYTLKNAVLSIPKAMEDIHGGVYKLRLKNESGVFESAASVDIDWPPEKKLRKLAEQKAKEEAKEEQEQKEKEEREKMEEALQNFVNRKLSDVKGDGKDEDKDSGLKIGEESGNGSEYESEYTDASEEDEDFYEEDTPFDTTIENNINSQDKIKTGNENNVTESYKGEKQNDIIECDSGESPEALPNINHIKNESVNAREHKESDTNTNNDNIYNVDDSSSGVSCNSNPKSHQQNNLDEEISHPPDETSIKCDSNNFNEERNDDAYDQVNSGNNPSDEITIKCDSSNLNLETNYDTYQQVISGDYALQKEPNQEEFTNKSEQCDANTACKIQEDLDSQNELGENRMKNGANSSNVPNSEHISNDDLEIAEHYVTDDKKIQDDLDMCDLTSDKLNASIHSTDFQSENDCVEKTKADQIDVEYQKSTESIHFEDSEQINVEWIEEPPKVVFNLDEHLANLQDQLDLKLKAAGFSRSKTVSEEKFGEGDKCLIALLDQMNRDDQDFKVWERDDYSFLRWYVTKQMETLNAKVDNLKFAEAIEGDVQAYIDKMSDDGVPLDRAFIQAAATIFNKDIILIPTEGETDFEVVVGGLSSPRGKGAPLYLGHIKNSENNSDIFISVLPDQIDSNRISSILAGDLINTEDLVTEEVESQEEIVTDVEEVVTQDVETIAMPNNIGRRQWKRMDSYNGSASKELDHIIQDILNEDSFEELNKSLHKCEVESESDNENSDTYHPSEDSNKTEAFPESEPEQDPWKDYEEHASTEYNNDNDNADLVGAHIENVENNGQNISDEQIDELKCSIEHEEKHLDHLEKVKVEDSSITELPLKNEDTHNQKYVEEDESSEGWTYDSNTGYWVQDDIVSVEQINEDTAEACQFLEVNGNEDVNCDSQALEESRANNNSIVTESVAPEPYYNNEDVSTYPVYGQDQAESNVSRDKEATEDLKESEKLESAVHDEDVENVHAQQHAQESYMKEADITENNLNNDEKEESCEGWTYDPNTGYWTEDTVEFSEENNPNKNETLQESDEVDNDTISKNISVPLENLVDNYITQFQEVKRNDVCEPLKEINENINETYPLSDNSEEETETIRNISVPFENLAENYIAQFQEVKTDDVSAPLKEINENTTETYQSSDNTEVENENFKNISERLQNLAASQFQEIKTYPSSGADSDKNLDCTENVTSAGSCDMVKRNENPFSDPSKDIQSKENSQELISNPPQNLCQEKKLVKRRIRIKVSVSEHDQVKEFEDCSPVALALSSSNPVLPDIMDCISGGYTKEISEINESTADNVETTEINTIMKNDSQFDSIIKTEKDNIESDKLISKQNASDIEGSEGKRGPIKKYTKKINKTPNNDKQNSEINLVDRNTNCAKVCETDTNTFVGKTADGQTVEVKMRPPLRKYSEKRTASYRWSGTEMMQIEGPPIAANNDSENIEVITKPNIDLLQATRMNISYKKANAGLDKKLTKLGFARSSTYKEFHKDGDNCLKALIDQMSQPGQDFKVWDKDDFSFLRWYIAKQLEIQISAGKAENYVKFNIDSPQTYVSNIQQDEQFIDNDYLYSVAKIFNKDIVVIESSNPKQEVTYIKGGQNNLNGKGKPIFLGHLTKEDAGNDFYQSIVPNESVHIEQLLSSLQENN